jgi:hypothetical protein
MKRIVRLTESDLTRIIINVIKEQEGSDGPNKKLFDNCISLYVKPNDEDLETFFNRPEVKKTCLAIRNNLKIYDDLLKDNKYIKDNTTKINILTNCFYSLEKNKISKQGKVDDKGNIVSKGDDRYLSFIECLG